jgi:dihydrofolate reductase
MRKVVVNEFMSLDGVVQAPGGPQEDTDGGFGHGGWHLGYFDAVAERWVTANIVEAGAFLLGRRTWEIFAGYWPTAPEEERTVGDPLNVKPKYVASRTLSEPLGWQNSHLLPGEAEDAIRSLRDETDGGDLHVIGSANLVQMLNERDLVDEYRLMIDPLLIGEGKQLFRLNTGFRPLRLIHGEVTSTGAFLATYAPADR